MNWQNQTAVLHPRRSIEMKLCAAQSIQTKKIKHDAHTIVGIPTIYLIEIFDESECARTTVDPAKTNARN
jgi:hypothetical protein